MKEFVIKLNSMEEAKRFVNITSKYHFEIDVKSGRYTVNAKSLLGVFSIDLSREVIVEIHTEEYAKFCEEIKQFRTE